MVRLRGAEAVFLGVLAVCGCVYVGGFGRTATTEVHSADVVTTSSPTLPAFVLRLAMAKAALTPEQSALARRLADQDEELARPIDGARVAFLEVLVRSLDEGRFDESAARGAADAVVQAVTRAAPKLDEALATLHATLDPWQRRDLALAVASGYAGWSDAWNGHGGVELHPWLASIPSSTLDSSIGDTALTARRWANGLVNEVRANAGADEASRRALKTKLRAH